MKILLDLQGMQCGSSVRGIGRYSSALARAMLRQAGGHDISIMLNHTFNESIDVIREDFRPLIEEQKILIWQSLMPVAENNSDNRWRTKTAEILREQFIQNISPDIVHVSSLIEGICDDAVTSIAKFEQRTPAAVTHYDIIPYLNSDKYLLNSITQNWYFDKLESLKKAQLILAISAASRQELITHLKIPADKIVTISTDADAIFTVKTMTEEQQEAVFKQYDIHKKYIMYTGVIAEDDPRKNVIGLIHAFALLPQTIRQSYQLLLVGGVSAENRSALIKQANKVGLSKGDLIFTNYINDNELVILYNLCHLFVFPSLHEGFGLPVLEAMRCGAPVIASNCSSIPEVVGLKEAQFDPHSDQSIADKMHQALTDNAFYQVLLQNSKKQSRIFSWDKTATTALDAFAALDAQLQTEKQTKADNKPLISIVNAIKQIDGSPSAFDLARTALAIAENQPASPHAKQLFVDVTHLMQHNLKSGIQRVVKNLLRELSQSPPAGYRICSVYRHNGQYYYTHNNYKDSGTDFSSSNDPIEVSPQDIFLGLDLDNVKDEAAARFLNHHRQRGMKLYFVVYDILPLLYPNLFPEDTESFFSSWFNKVSHIADGLIAISRAVVDEIIAYLDKHPAKRILPLNIAYFHLGANIPENQFNANESYDISKIPFAEHSTIFLMVGSIEPRKAHEEILDAMEQLWQEKQNISLVIVGKEGWHVEAFIQRLEKHEQSNKQLFCYENADDELLKQLYQQSSALIMASKGEGFGLPLIEAAQHQLPIICRDIPVFREVAGDHAFYFTVGGSKTIAEQLLEWNELFAASNHPDSSQLSYIDWSESKQQLVDVVIGQNWYKKIMPHP